MRSLALLTELSQSTKRINILFLFFLVPFLSNAQTFITTWKTDNPGVSNDNQITIPTTGAGYDYNVVWSEEGNPANTGTLLTLTGNVTIDFPTPGIYRIEISGLFPRIFFNDPSFFFSKDSRKILTVEQWGANPWTSMASAFAGCANLRINASDKPNLAGVTDMSRMFYRASSLNDNLNAWNVSTITNMSRLFADAEAFNQPLNAWNVSSVTNMSEMFWFARAFNQDISGWNVSNVTNMAAMFAGATIFNQNIGGWNVINVTTLAQTFASAPAFNQNISAWNVGNVTDMSGLFSGASAFNQDISGWNINNVTSMANMFRAATSFTNDITGWNVINVTQMNGMFSDHPTFNQDITAWTVDNVNDMNGMFDGATAFNQDISGWHVNKVNDFNSMFQDATSFNQPIGAWTLNTVSNIDMRGMFDGASSFDQDLSPWDVRQLTQAFNMLNNSGLSVTHYDNLLEGWASQTLKPNVDFGASNLFYCTGETARTNLISTFNWFITDGGKKCISLFDGPTTTTPEILNGQPQVIDYGSTSTSKSRSFTLSNNQGTVITNVMVVNPGSGFPTSLVFPTILAGATQTFTVDLTGPVGTYTETVTITSPDFPGSFQFNVSGEVTATPEPEIAAFEGTTVLGTQILDGQLQPVEFGFEVKGNNLMGEFTITNIGDADLNISDITLSGSVFTLASTPPTLIPVNGTEIIQVILSGTNAGIFIETVNILSDDTDEAIFNFNVYGEIIGPDIAVYDGTNIYSDPEIFDGQVTPIDFGSGPNGTDILRPFTIANLNSADLNISNITITGTAFSLTSSPPTLVAAEFDGVISFTPFFIRLSGATSGTYSETVSIFTDDEDEPTFTFQINGSIIGSGCPILPTVNAGVDATTCAGSSIILAGTIGGSATGATWNSNGTGTFDDQTILTPTYTPGAADETSGSVILTLTVAAIGSCPQVQDNLILSIPTAITAGSPSVQSNVGQTSIIDVVSSSTTNPGDVLTLTITQNPTQGSVTVNANNTVSFVPNAGTVGSDSFEYQICNDCGLCDVGTVSIDIVNAPPVITPPSAPITAVAGQSVTIPFVGFLSDLNGNIDFNSIQITNGPTSNALASFNTAFDLTLDYSNTRFAGTDEITIEVCDLLNSCSSIILQIEVDGEIIIHNGISPNGDGKNDYFSIQNIQFLEPENKVSIYNRWGDKIFDLENYDSDNPNKRFNGISDNGKELPSGVYFYKIQLVNRGENLSGYLTIKK
jgi:gliding motility-associated-like protein